MRLLFMWFGFLVCILVQLSTAAPPSDPLFDWSAILNDPLDAKVLKQSELEGVVIEEIEFTSRPGERVCGILGYPKGGTNLPAIFWSQSGMYDAGDYFPKIFARKGYACFNITLPHAIRKSQDAFDTQSPSTANLTLLARDQLRGITYLSQRPEVDPDRLAMGGASYGGFFATLLAGADPRIKAGFSFFAGGNHELGTNLPQFRALKTPAEIAIWNQTIDPAWRLQQRAVPFLWCAAANDNWFYLPAVVKTYEQSIGEKRLAILPQWQHGFPENVDQQLIDWADIWLTKTRPPYNQVSALKISDETARWSWTGDNKVVKAELIVSYGAPGQWVQRYHHIVPAKISANHADAKIPRLRQAIPAHVYGNIIDDRGVVISTVPVSINLPAGPTAKVTLNGMPFGDFEPADVDYLKRSGFEVAAADTTDKKSGTQSLRLDAGGRISWNPWHVPGLAHKLRLWLRSAQPCTIQISVNAGASQTKLAPSLTPTWTAHTLDCPAAPQDVAGYNLTIQTTNTCGSVWVDDVRFYPE